MINLGQGFPDTDGPSKFSILPGAIRSGQNQYPLGIGVELVCNRRTSGAVLGPFDPDTEVLGTAGATEALAGALLGTLEPGDEVVVFEPMYDFRIKRLHCQERRLFRCCCDQPQTDIVDEDELRAAISPQTRSILLNTPQPDRQSVHRRDTFISSLAIEHDLMVITDEVYEHLIFDGREHVSMAGFPECVSEPHHFVGRKDVQTPGWKIGGLYKRTASCRNECEAVPTYGNGAPFQPAIGGRLVSETTISTNSQPGSLTPEIASSRTRVVGFNVFPSEATYFTTVDITPLRPDGDWCRLRTELPHKIGVVAIPNQVFYVNPEHGRNLVRFAELQTTRSDRRGSRAAHRIGGVSDFPIIATTMLQGVAARVR